MNRALIIIALLATFAQTPLAADAGETVMLDIHNFTPHDVRVVICSANGSEKKDLTRCLGDEPDTWTLQVSPGHKVISTFDKDGVLLATYPVIINKTKKHSHLNSILIFNGKTFVPAYDNSAGEKTPPNHFCNGFSDKKDCRP